MCHPTEKNIPLGVCQCGCGKKTSLPQQTSKRFGWVRGQPLQFVRGHHLHRSLDERLWAGVTKGEGCWLWKGVIGRRSGGRIKFKGRYRSVGQVVWEATYGPVPPGMLICHKCDNPPCMRPDHLFLGTHADNQADMARKGRAARGERNARAKLTEASVRAIRKRAFSGESQVSLAMEYGLSTPGICSVIHGKAWKHVDAPTIPVGTYRVQGERVGSARLTESDVMEIRRRVASGESQSSLAKALDIGTTTVHFIVHRKTWKHI